jgi:glucose/mannose-6-phosphate isomerase
MSEAQFSFKEKYKLVADTIRAYPMQLRQSWDEISQMFIPEDYKDIKNVVFAGMGGSALGARIVDSLLVNRLRIPFEIYNEYHIPNYVNDESLVVVSSYSGETEETLDCLHESLNKGAKIFGITTGGKLGNILKERNIPSYVIDPVNNPSKQPRMSIGYAIGSILAVLTKLEVVHFSTDEMDQAIFAMNNALTDFNENVPETRNLAKVFSKKLYNKFPILVASEHLVGTAHTIKNQFNESAKTFCVLFDLPELNHHLMEGLAHPAKMKDYMHFVFLTSNQYSEEVKKRYPITQKVLEKNNVEFSVFNPNSETKLEQIFETLAFGSSVAYLMTKEYKIDPLDIPWVEFFKEEMAKKR